MSGTPQLPAAVRRDCPCAVPCFHGMTKLGQAKRVLVGILFWVEMQAAFDSGRWPHVSWDTPFVLQLRPDLDKSKSHLQPGLQGREEHASEALCSIGAEMPQSVSGSAGEHAASRLQSTESLLLLSLPVGVGL